MEYLEMTALALIVVYIVDISGFTQAWRSALSKWLGISPASLRPLPPFDCSKCAVWWASLIHALACGELSVWTVLWASVLSLLSGGLSGMLCTMTAALDRLIEMTMKRIIGNENQGND